MPNDAPRATLADGTELPVERLAPDGAPRRRLPIAFLRHIEWKSFAAGAGLVAVSGALGWLGTKLWKRKGRASHDG